MRRLFNKYTGKYKKYRLTDKWLDQNLPLLGYKLFKGILSEQVDKVNSQIIQNYYYNLN